MPKLKDLTNQTFGFWTVLNEHRSIKKHTHWKCKCICGKEILVKQESLVSGRSKSCGCKKIDLRFKTANINPLISTQKRCYGNYQRGAIKRGLKFELNFNEFIKLTQQYCHYCGQKPTSIYKKKYNGGKNFIYNGIDRTDNNKGYILSNCVTSCYQCNRSKYTMNKKIFLEWIKRIYEYNFK